MSGIDQDKIDGLRELIKLLLALTRAEQPRMVYPSPFMPPVPSPGPPPSPPPEGNVSISLLHAAEVIERGGARALEAIRTGTEDARAALVQLAQQRDLEQQAVDRVIEAITELRSVEREHHHPRHHPHHPTPPAEGGKSGKHPPGKSSPDHKS